MSEDKIGTIGRIARVISAVIRNIEPDCLPPADHAHPYRLAFPIHRVGMYVVTWWARIRRRHAGLAALLLQCKGAFHGFGGLHPRLNQQIGHECGVVGFEWVVRRVVQLHTIRDLLLPSNRAHGVKHRRELAAGFGKIGGLRDRWGQF